MASTSEPIERLRSRIRLLYVLIAFLYAGLFLNIYLTVRLFYREKAAIAVDQNGFDSQEIPNSEDISVEDINLRPDLIAKLVNTDKGRLIGPPIEPRKSVREKVSDRESGYLEKNDADYIDTGHLEGENEREKGFRFAEDFFGLESSERLNDKQDEIRKETNSEISFDSGDLKLSSSDNHEYRRNVREVGEQFAHGIGQEDVLHRKKRWASSRRARQYTPPRNSRPSVDFYEKPQPKQDSDESIWLTSYSKIPMEVLEEYCIAVRNHCPPGEKGSMGDTGHPGLSGMKGERGDRGFPGDPGPRGPQGFTGNMGPVGPKGEGGKLGIPGLDGRDGIPGEPGLDGVPGRDGIDGIPGRDGIPGVPGSPGRPGTNGTNGIPGSPGPRGLDGPIGPKGQPGPRGRKGPPGDSGKDGQPGIRAWSVGGSNDTHKLLIPPSIVDTKQETSLIVEEGTNVRLQCTATGQPKPQISWRRADNKSITNKAWQQSSIPDTLEIYRIGRDQIGTYKCIASNGVPPDAEMDIKVEVAFPPLIKVRNTNIPTHNGSSAFLECVVEAHPQPLNYWWHDDKRMIEPSWKYKTNQKDDGYRTIMTLNITSIEHWDYGKYSCVSKNEKGEAIGLFNVFQTDGEIPPTPPPVDTPYQIFGQRPPSGGFKDAECEPCESQCQPPQFCASGGGQTYPSKVQIDFISHLPKYTTPPPRRDNCMIHQLGKPVFQRASPEEQGSWYQDSLPLPENQHKYYVTYITDTTHLYEYENRDMFRNNTYSMKYDLQFDFTGNAHVIYNGSFYFQQQNSKDIIRFEMATNSRLGEPVAGAAYTGDHYLYSTDMSYMDITADENGLWVIYSNEHSNNTIVQKLNSYTLKPEFTWNISLHHRHVGDMFICCGVLYAVDSVSVTNTQISFAYDLYQTKALDVNIPFSNPFRQNSMVTYNPSRKKIFTWDKGNQLIYPILYGTIDLGQPENVDNIVRNRK